MNNGFNDLVYKFDDFVNIAKCELDQIIQKGSVTPSELDSVYKIVNIAEKIKELNADQESMQYGYGMMPNARMNRYDYGYGYGYGDPGYSEERGRSPVTGRYISRGMSGRGGNNNGGGGYSGHSIEDRMIASLEQQMDQAQSDYERNMIEEEINHIRMKSQGK